MIRLLFLAAGVALAADKAVPPIVELARAAPPEFFADAVVRLIQAGRIPQRDLQVDLLEQAFAAASFAAEPVREIAIPGTPPDSREIYRSKAGDLALDRFSLQSRIVRELATLDRAKARALFDSIGRPKLDPRPCADALTGDAAPYYDAAAAIAQSAFSEREKQADAHVQFLAALLAGAGSPNELAAWARATQSVGLSIPQWRLLIAALAAKLNAMAPDYRPFALSLDALQMELRNLSELARANGFESDELPRAFRKYVVEQLKGARCAPEIALGLDQISWLQPPISEEEAKPAKRLESFQATLYFQSADSRQLGESLSRLREGGVNRGALLADFLRDFGAWRPEGSDTDVFHQRATIARALLEMTPRGEDRDRVLGISIAILEARGADRQNPAEWLWEARAIADAAKADAPKLTAAFRGSENVSLSLYAQLGYFGDSSGTSK